MKTDTAFWDTSAPVPLYCRQLEPWLARHPDDAAAQHLVARARAGQSAAH